MRTQESLYYQGVEADDKRRRSRRTLGEHMKIKYLIIIILLLGLLIASTTTEDDEERDSRPFCKTVDEAAMWVFLEMEAGEIWEMAHFHEEGLAHLHITLGVWIRNNVPVWHNTTLLESVGKDVHPDTVGGMILHKYWLFARQQLPDSERSRIEYFEKTLRGLKGSKPKGETHESVIFELNYQIESAWPKDAPYQPYILVAEEGTYFTWEPKEMGEGLDENVKRFLRYNQSLPFYDGDNLIVGIPE